MGFAGRSQIQPQHTPICSAWRGAWWKQLLWAEVLVVTDATRVTSYCVFGAGPQTWLATFASIQQRRH